jgi:lipoprotein-anchoring transpeptidase ErfK/SrfK
MAKLKTAIKQIMCGVGFVTAIAAAGYAAVVAPVIPYFVEDVKEKSKTEQDDIIEYAKSVWGAFVWYPKNKIEDSFNSDLEEKVILVNKATQTLYIYDEEGILEREVKTSTGASQGIKRTYKQSVTSPGEYIAVRRFDRQGLKEWFEGKRAPEDYGAGMLLFLGKWFPRIAIHGTTKENEEYLGQERSMGCARVDEETITYLLENAAVGTRMIIHEYAVLPYTAKKGMTFDKYLLAEGVTTAAKRQEAEDAFYQNNPFANSVNNIAAGGLFFMKDYNDDKKIGTKGAKNE